jgi:hypothetical protein
MNRIFSPRNSKQNNVIEKNQGGQNKGESMIEMGNSPLFNPPSQIIEENPQHLSQNSTRQDDGKKETPAQNNRSNNKNVPASTPLPTSEFTLHNGCIYKGQVNNLKPEGYGEVFFVRKHLFKSDEMLKVFEGFFKDGLYHGEGTLYSYRDSQQFLRYTGRYESGKYQEGTLHYWDEYALFENLDPPVFTGTFQNNLPAEGEWSFGRFEYSGKFDTGQEKANVNDNANDNANERYKDRHYLTYPGALFIEPRSKNEGYSYDFKEGDTAFLKISWSHSSQSLPHPSILRAQITINLKKGDSLEYTTRSIFSSLNNDQAINENENIVKKKPISLEDADQENITLRNVTVFKLKNDVIYCGSLNPKNQPHGDGQSYTLYPGKSEGYLQFEGVYKNGKRQKGTLYYHGLDASSTDNNYLFNPIEKNFPKFEGTFENNQPKNGKLSLGNIKYIGEFGTDRWGSLSFMIHPGTLYRHVEGEKDTPIYDFQPDDTATWSILSKSKDMASACVGIQLQGGDRLKYTDPFQKRKNGSIM